MELLHLKNYKSHWCILLMLFIFFLFNNNGVQGFHNVYMHYQSLSKAVEGVKQVHRTGYHFQPKSHWINGMVNPRGLLSLISLFNYSIYYRILFYLFLIKNQI